jgi:hypothetical protein
MFFLYIKPTYCKVTLGFFQKLYLADIEIVNQITGGSSSN